MRVNRKSILFLIVFAFLSTFAFAANLRDFVCVVRPNISEKNSEFLTKYRNTLVAKGYKSYGDQIDAYLKGRFGSGFVVYGSDGKAYVLTNQHVVSNAESATVQFENEDGSTSEFKELKIVAIDEEVDVALIALPAAYKKPGLTLKSVKVNDGDDVWSAGFPGLGNEPIWQFGKGIVSNASARIKELLNPEISPLIQHSAQVDAGNSGGPLLITDSRAAAGYSVIGINTWKAVQRENTNFAIPAAVISNFVNKAVSNKLASSIEDRIASFNKTMANKDATYSEVARFISDSLIADCGEDVLIAVLQKAPSNVKTAIVTIFAYNPIDGIRAAVAYNVFNTFHKGEEVVDYKTSTVEQSGDGYKVEFIFDEGKSFETTWIKEFGNWKLSNFDNQFKGKISTSKLKQSAAAENGGFSISEPYRLYVRGGIIIPPSGCDVGFEVEAGFLYTYFGFGFFFKSENSDVIWYDSFKNRKGSGPLKLDSYGVSIRIQVPLNFNYVMVVPYASARVGATNFGSDTYNSDFGFGATLGADVTLSMVSDNFAPFVGFEYIFSTFTKDQTTNNVAVTFGFRALGK